jgi:hypothetical protein
MLKWQHKAIFALVPNAEYRTMHGNDEIESIEWITDPAPQVTLEQIKAKAIELEAAEGYKTARQYPSIQEQLDMQYWDSVNGTTVWADTIAAVKATNPKPE